MTTHQFNKFCLKFFVRALDVLDNKTKEYGEADDRFIHFTDAGEKLQRAPEEALWGMLQKHLTSLSRMCSWLTIDSTHVSVEVWDEKILDSINYLLLLGGMIHARVEK